MQPPLAPPPAKHHASMSAMRMRLLLLLCQKLLQKRCILHPNATLGQFLSRAQPLARWLRHNQCTPQPNRADSCS